MKFVRTRLLVLLPALALLGACAGHTTRGMAVIEPATSPHPASSEPAGPVHRNTQAGARRHHASGNHADQAAPAEASSAAAPADQEGLPDDTGITACDEYLSSYVACHRAAGIYRPDQIGDHYQAMRTSLLRDADDPSIRPQLAARCNALATQLRRALHGRSCNGAPASSGSNPGQ